ncbi:putative leader peptide [Amycolatopsis jejuensis]
MDELPITLLTQRRAVDLCRVRSSLCLRSTGRR